VSVGTLIAVISNVDTPLDAVGSEFIDNTPKWLKISAIRWFGTNDKFALRVGIVVIITGLAIAVGAIARRRRVAGVVAIAIFGIFGGVITAGRPSQSALAAIPSIFGAAIGCWLLWQLIGIITKNDGATQIPGTSRAPLRWDRRRFISATSAAAVISAVAAITARKIKNQNIAEVRAAAPDVLPSIDTSVVSPQSTFPAGAQIFSQTPFITPNDNFYRIDTALSLPRINIKTWNLQIGGMVNTPLQFSYDDLLARKMVEYTITICCVSNEVGGKYIGNATWQGVLLADLLNEAGVDLRAEQVFGTSVDGWTCGFPVGAALDGRDSMIAIGMNGEPLPLEHGFPARVIVPGLYGYVSATKWLERLDLTTWDQAEGYWVPLGWSRDGPIKTQSRIDVPRRGEDVNAGKVVIAGVAWAQHRGIAKVEVQIEKGPWHIATLALDVSDDTWRQWKYEWDATPGDYTIQVRATDKTGETQTQEVSPPDPDGATGYHTRSLTVL